MEAKLGNYSILAQHQDHTSKKAKANSVPLGWCTDITQQRESNKATMGPQILKSNLLQHTSVGDNGQQIPT